MVFNTLGSNLPRKEIRHESLKYPSKKNSKANSFRNTNDWITKREQIKRRDKYLCQVC